MSSNGTPAYKVQPLPIAARQMKDLGKKAAKLGIKAEFVESLKLMSATLAANPMTRGDPERNLKKSGATVYHAVFGLVFVQYVVFKAEKTVLVLKVVPMSNTTLDVP